MARGGQGGNETCTSETERLVVDGHGKGPAEWIRLNAAAVYYDHPARETPDHVLVIDFWGEAGRPSARVALELSAISAAGLARAIDQALQNPQARRDLSDVAAGP
ncbi:MAG: DUF6295 family protein [Acidimicrobiales bacterium]